MPKKLKNKKHSFDDYYSFWDSDKNYFIIVPKAKQIILTTPKDGIPIEYDNSESIEDFLYRHFRSKLKIVLTRNDISYLRET